MVPIPFIGCTRDEYRVTDTLTSFNMLCKDLSYHCFGRVCQELLGNISV